MLGMRECQRRAPPTGKAVAQAEGKADPSPRKNRGVRDDKLLHAWRLADSWNTAAPVRRAGAPSRQGCRRYQFGLRYGCIGLDCLRMRKIAARASAIFPVGFAFFYQGAEAFLGIFEAVELVQEDVHGLFQAFAEGEAHAAEDGFFGHA